MDNQEVYERYQAGVRSFEGVDLRGACLNGFDLQGASLRKADLGGADLGDANLCQADLKGADLGKANLRHAFLNGADLRMVDLRDADLRSASLEGVDLRGANLFGTLIDKNTEIEARWRQLWEVVNRAQKEQINSLQIKTRLKPEGGARAELVIEDEPLAAWFSPVNLYELVSSLGGSGEYWIIGDDADYAGIGPGVNVFWDRDQVQWAIVKPAPGRVFVFDARAYREAIRHGVRHFVDCCRQHPGQWGEGWVNANYNLVDADLDALLGAG